jgi:D-alanyl-D-alanine carboxypeptidase
MVIAALLTAILLFAFFETHHRDTVHRANTQHTSKQAAVNGQQAAGPVAFDKHQRSTTDAASLWVVVNKPLPLSPITYVPADLVNPNIPLRTKGEEMLLRKDAATALEQLAAGAKADGYNLMLASGYRSYSFQVNLYNGYVRTQGQAAADRTSARPGHSEHQTGLAADLEPTSRKCEVEACFGDLAEGKWLAANAYKYGFIIRYTADKIATTGYDYEPWHVRYVGTDLAAEMHTTGAETLEEFFDVPGGASFN